MALMKQDNLCWKEANGSGPMDTILGQCHHEDKTRPNKNNDSLKLLRLALNSISGGFWRKNAMVAA